MAENKKITPTQVNQLSFNYDHVYEPVDWKDGITPINQKNLNKSEQAINNLLGENIGYIQNIISKLNTEIDARTNDVSAISNETSNLNEDLSDLDNKLYNQDRGDIITLRRDIASNLNSITTILLSLTTLTDRVTGIENMSNVTIIVSTIQEINAALRLLSDKLYDSTTGDIPSLDNLITALNTKLSKIESDLNNVIENGVIPDNAIISGDDVYLNCGTSDTVLQLN